MMRRYADLQRRYGRWGLAYLESLLRAAGWAASAEQFSRHSAGRTDEMNPSSEDRTLQAGILFESLVEGNHLESRRLGESCKVGVVPGLRRESWLLRELLPTRFNARRFKGETYAGVGRNRVEQFPSLILLYRCFRKNSRTVRKTQKSNLSESAKLKVPKPAIEPSSCRLVMEMGRKCECQPDVDIRKIHSLISSSL